MATSKSTATETDDENLGAPVGDREAYLESAKQKLPNYTNTIDATDKNIGHTVQSEGGISHPEGAAATQPGQVFAPWQLPNPNAAIRANQPVISVPEHLVMEHDDAVGHVQGPDPLDIITHDHRESLAYPMIATSTGVTPTGAALEDDGEEDDGDDGERKAPAKTAATHPAAHQTATKQAASKP
jgi:hypothetical protein